MFITNLIKGTIVGVGGILPGVSGGMMAVTLGIYVPAMNALATLTRDFGKKLLFLLPIGIGGVIGIVLGSVVLKSLFTAFETAFIYAFAGLILGGVPAYVKEIAAPKFKPIWLIASAVGIGLALLLMLLPMGSSEQLDELNALQYLLAGMIIVFGSIIPGLSTSFLFIRFGWYKCVLGAISQVTALHSIQLLPLLLMAIGGVICAVMFIKLINYLFTRFKGYAGFFVLGFLLTTMIFALPLPEISWAQLMYLALLGAGLVLGYYLDSWIVKLSEFIKKGVKRQHDH